ncbi:MAG: NAD(P) transhydrogenase subunit alpha [Planctomycetota bacterium]
MLVLAPLLATAAGEDPASRFIRLLTVFLLARWVGFEVITKVPQRLHTPLTSGSNAISGITAVGAIVVAGAMVTGMGTVFGFLALVLAMINVVGGFVVTHRMLAMFNPKKK